MSAFADDIAADFIIEAVPERMDLKVKVFQDLAKVAPETAIFASNTSALSISEMGHKGGRPERTVGMHFFSPAHVMKLVEIIPGLDTTQETVDDVVMFTESLRKLAVVVQECPGFLVNRLLMPYLNEATWCLQEGAATAADIDAALTEFGMPMGPFTLMDMLGIDVCQYVGDYLSGEYGPRMEGAQLFTKLVAAGRLGEEVSLSAPFWMGTVAVLVGVAIFTYGSRFLRGEEAPARHSDAEGEAVLVGDAGRSPISGVLGSRNQWTIGGNIAYSFTMKPLVDWF